MREAEFRRWNEIHDIRNWKLVGQCAEERWKWISSRVPPPTSEEYEALEQKMVQTFGTGNVFCTGGLGRLSVGEGHVATERECRAPGFLVTSNQVFRMLLRPLLAKIARNVERANQLHLADPQIQQTLQQAIAALAPAVDGLARQLTLKTHGDPEWEDMWSVWEQGSAAILWCERTLRLLRAEPCEFTMV